jgi:hypothetical protein
MVYFFCTKMVFYIVIYPQTIYCFIMGSLSRPRSSQIVAWLLKGCIEGSSWGGRWRGLRIFRLVQLGDT